MHSLGNDFVVIVDMDRKLSLNRAQAKSIADRNTGVGCDQILLVKPIHNQTNAFSFEIFNQDGSESAQCGNGARCVARLLHDHRLTDDDEIILRTQVDDIRCRIDDETTVTVALGVPCFEPAKIPFVADSAEFVYELEVNRQLHSVSVLSIGNPHAVLVVPDVAKAPVRALGGAIECHPRFPKRTNVGFMEVESPKSIRLRVFERGVGETHACGSGASAAVIAGRRLGMLSPSVTVNVQAGQLNVAWKCDGEPVYLSGSTTVAFHGELPLD